MNAVIFWFRKDLRLHDQLALRAAGLQVQTVWQSSLLDPALLPFSVSQLPRVFTPFRQAVEKAQLHPAEPLPAPTTLPPLPEGVPAEYLQAHDAARFDTWRAGAAWYEHHLVDYDVHSNQGNWLYIAGRGTDPQGGRRFNPLQQANAYDPDGAYQRLWRAA